MPAAAKHTNVPTLSRSLSDLPHPPPLQEELRVLRGLVGELRSSLRGWEVRLMAEKGANGVLEAQLRGASRGLEMAQAYQVGGPYVCVGGCGWVCGGEAGGLHCSR